MVCVWGGGGRGCRCKGAEECGFHSEGSTDLFLFLAFVLHLAILT